MLSIKERKQKWLDFYDMTSGVNRINMIHCGEGMPERPLLWRENMTARTDWAYERYLQLIKHSEIIDDNTIPYLSLVTGTELFAEAFGCKVYKPLNNNPSAIPMIDNAAGVSKIKIPKLHETKLTVLFEMADKLSERAGKEALFGLFDLQSPMDISALIWDKNDFFAAMYYEPEAVRELAAKVTEFMYGFLDAWFGRYGNKFIAHYPDYYMEGGITLSEDEIGSVSPEMYKLFFEKELDEFSDRYGGIGVHCCANSEHQFDNLSKIKNLKVINLCLDHDKTLKSLKAFQDVCGQYPGYPITDVSETENPEKLHLVRTFYAATIEEAKVIAEKNPI